MTPHRPAIDCKRRQLLLGAFAATTLPFSPAIAGIASSPELKLNLYNLHTAETFNATFWAEGQYDLDALSAIDHLLRDHRTDEVKKIDSRLLSILYLINARLGNKRPTSVISGYRSRETNRRLAQTNVGVAKNSYHVKGRAIDIRMTGQSSTDIRDIALQLRVGGVGYYQRSDFVHLDTGPTRYW